MSNLLALATELRQLNETLERGNAIDQLVVEVVVGASGEEVDAAIDAACEARGISRDDVEQVVIVEVAQEIPEATHEPMPDPVPEPAPVMLDFDLLRGVAQRQGIAVMEMVPGDFCIQMNGNVLVRGDQAAAEEKLREVLGA